MSSKYLGQPFDIHAGGRDLVFPHHENEIAQAEGAEGKTFVKYWIHNGFININAEKMSKSLGNFMTIKDIVKKHGAEAVRYFIISNHYRSPIDYTDKAIQDASAALDRFYETAKRLPKPTKIVSEGSPANDDEKQLVETLDRVNASVEKFMDDDFNSAGAIGSIFEAVRSVNRYLDGNPNSTDDFYHFVLGRWQGLVESWENLLGIFGTDPEAYFESKKNRSASEGKFDADEIEQLLTERKEARSNKDFKRADEIRDQLSAMGIVIKDRPDGTTEWQVK